MSILSLIRAIIPAFVSEVHHDVFVTDVKLRIFFIRYETGISTFFLGQYITLVVVLVNLPLIQSFFRIQMSFG